MQTRFTTIVLVSIAFSFPAFGQTALPTLNEIVEGAVKARAQVAPSVRAPEKQTEAPAMSTNSSTLFDTTDVSDLVGVALNLGDLTATNEDSGGNDGSVLSATVTAYALYSALERFDPLSPEHYCQPESVRARRFSLTVGREDDEDGMDEAFMIGFKWKLDLKDGASVGRLLNEADDICFSDAFSEGGLVYEKMVGAGAAQGRLFRSISNSIAATAGLDPNDPATIVDRIEEDPLLNAQAKTLADQLVGPLAERTAELDAEIAEEIRRLTTGNRFALEFMTKQRDDGRVDDYMAALVLGHKGFLPGIDLTLNGGWEMKDNPNGMSDSHGGMAAFGISWQGLDDKASGRRPLRLSLSGKADWLSNREDTYKGQLKFVLPLLEGLELPISLTVANRTELVDETEVRGLVGFTLDTASFLKSLKQ